MPRLKLWAWQSSRVRQAVSSAAFVLSALTLLRTWCAVLLLVTYGFLLSYSDAAANPRAAVRYVETKMNWKFMLLFESIDIKFYGSNLSISIPLHCEVNIKWGAQQIRMVIHKRNDLTKLNRVLECGRVVIRLLADSGGQLGQFYSCGICSHEKSSADPLLMSKSYRCIPFTL